MIRKDEETTETYREFGFNLSGNRRGKRTGENFVEWGSFETSDKYTQITYANDPILKVDIHLEPANELVQSVAEILEELPAKTRERICDRHWLHDVNIVTPAMRSALRQIFNCPFQGKTKQIYLESKCLELITLKLEQLKQSDRSSAVFLKFYSRP